MAEQEVLNWIQLINKNELFIWKENWAQYFLPVLLIFSIFFVNKK